MLSSDDRHINAEPNLSALINQGDPLAFSRAHSEYKTRLLYYARRLIGDDHAAEDIVSEAFLTLWRAKAKIRSDDHLRNFLYLTVRHRVLNYLNAEQRHRKVLDQAIDPSAETETIDPEEVQAEMIHLLRQAVQSLPTEYRRIFELSYDRELSPGEIARLLNINPSTVRTQKKRALDLIREWIRKHPSTLAIILLNFF